MKMDYPTIEEVKAASLEQVQRWYNELPYPENAAQGVVMHAIIDRQVMADRQKGFDGSSGKRGVTEVRTQ